MEAYPSIPPESPLTRGNKKEERICDPLFYSGCATV